MPALPSTARDPFSAYFPAVGITKVVTCASSNGYSVSCWALAAGQATWTKVGDDSTYDHQVPIS
jgi:hypothetical protein